MCHIGRRPQLVSLSFLRITYLILTNKLAKGRHLNTAPPHRRRSIQESQCSATDRCEITRDPHIVAVWCCRFSLQRAQSFQAPSNQPKPRKDYKVVISSNSKGRLNQQAARRSLIPTRYIPYQVYTIDRLFSKHVLRAGYSVDLPDFSQPPEAHRNVIR